MSRYSGLRAVQIEGRRSAAPLLIVATAATGIVTLFVHPSDWAGRWMGLATYLWTELILVVPLVAAVACWQAGRERRRGLDELLGSTPRPGWQPLAAGWAALVLAAGLGLGLTWAVGAWFVARQASYAGGGWAWLSAETIVPVAAAAGLGFAVGRGIPSRLIGLPLAVGLYILIGLAIYGDDTGKQWLVPYLYGPYLDHRLRAATYVWQILWFGALAVGTLTAAAMLGRTTAERPRLPFPVMIAAVAALVVAGSAGFVLGSGPGTARWVPDRAADLPVCSRQGPPVCLTKVDAFLLDEVVAQLQPALRRLSGIPAAPVRAVEVANDQTTPADALQIASPSPDLSGRLEKPGGRYGDLAWESVSSLFICQQDFARWSSLSDTEARQSGIATDVATAWSLDSPVPAGDDLSRMALTALRTLPASAQRDWIGDDLLAARSCDIRALPGLMNRIGAR